MAPLGVPAWAWSLAALLLGVTVSLWLAHSQQRRTEAEHRQEAKQWVQAGREAVLDRLRAGELLVRSVQTLFMASLQVQPQEFSFVYANLQPRQRFPSLQAMAYAQRVPGPDGVHYPTALIAPAVGNERLTGLDVTLQPTNYAALLASRDSDQVAMSAPFRLVQTLPGKDTADPGASAQGAPLRGGAQQPRPNPPVDGITMRLPIYSRGPPPQSVAERRARMQGSLAVSFRVGNLIRSALPEELREQVHLRVTDVTDARPLLLYDSHPLAHVDALHQVQTTLQFGGRTWRLSMQPLARGMTAGGWADSVLWPGLIASMLFALLVWSTITSRRRALEQGWRMSRRYRESDERFRALNELLPALVLLADGADGRISYANQAARLRLGENVGELALATLFEDPQLREQLCDEGVTAYNNVDAVLRSANGDRFWASVSIARVEVGGHRMLMVASDISEQRQLTELLSYQASHDALTELYNRREFERRVERALAAIAGGGAPAALLYIDLDQFKLINDTSGHIAGDQLLTQLAGIMREHLRGGDVLARLGGDEFGVLAANVDDEDGARLVAERLRARIDGYVFVWEQRTYTIGASIGGVMLDQAGATLNDLLTQADTACYMAKESGRNRVHFYSAQDDETTRRRSEMEWANRLRWAIDERLLLLKYQEVSPLPATGNDGACIELLLRFRDQGGRLVVPAAFMPAAERYGLMPMIDRWVIETALSNFDRLHPSGPDLKLATINLSGASIEDESLAELILELLERHQVEPGRVCFEITETVAVRNLAQVGRFIARLREVGCRIALDDFGAGMSSFGYLKNLPVDIIKIDGGFIRDLLTDPMSHAIVRAVTEIGHQRGLLVVAEWVSSEEILQALVEIGVDYAQGFYLHRPEPIPLHHDS